MRDNSELVRLVLPVIGKRQRRPRGHGLHLGGTRLLRAFPQVPCSRPGTLRDLASRWPSDEVVLVIDAGDEDELTLSARNARWLLGRCSSAPIQELSVPGYRSPAQRSRDRTGTSTHSAV